MFHVALAENPEMKRKLDRMDAEHKFVIRVAAWRGPAASVPIVASRQRFVYLVESPPFP